MSRPPHEFYMTEPPTAPVGTRVWGPEVMEDMSAALRDAQLRLLLGARTLALLDRVKRAPNRETLWRRVSWSDVDLVPHRKHEEGWYTDRGTGLDVVREDDGGLFREVPHPRGAFTLGEMTELEARLWGAGEAMAQAAERGMLRKRQRHAAVGVVEAADNLRMRLMFQRWHPDKATAERVKRDVLRMIAERDE